MENPLFAPSAKRLCNNSNHDNKIIIHKDSCTLKISSIVSICGYLEVGSLLSLFLQPLSGSVSLGVCFYSYLQ